MSDEETGTLFELPVETPETPLPTLIGSERQKAWAEQIRKGKLKACQKLHEQQGRLAQQYAEARNLKAVEATDTYLKMSTRLDYLCAQTNCSWWISRRDTDANDLISGAPARPGDGLTD